MYPMLQHAHSGLRWIVLLLLVLAIINALMKWQGNKAYTEGDRKLNLFAMISAHVQLLVGIAVYLVSPKVVFTSAAMKDAVARFFLVEHGVMMLIAIVLITIGHARVKRGATDTAKFKSGFIFYGIALLIILYAIPWPFQNYGTGWF